MTPTQPPPVPPPTVHVQNIQAQNIQVQNVLVQPTATLDQTIQGQNVQLQTLQVSQPYQGIQIQNIGSAPTVDESTSKLIKTEPTTVAPDYKTEPSKMFQPHVLHTSAVTASSVSAASAFQLPGSVSVSNAPSYIMTYSDQVPVLVSQPMLVNLEPPQTSTAPTQWTVHPVIFSNNVCCLTTQQQQQQQQQSAEVKHARTPVVPVNTQLTHHSPQLPVPSPNYPVPAPETAPPVPPALDSAEPRNIPNRNVPILNNNYIHSGNVHHSELITSHSTTGARTLHGDVAADAVKNTSDTNTNSVVVYSEHLSSNNNELFNNQVANVSEVNSSDKADARTNQVQALATPTTTTTSNNTQTKDYESLITINQIVNTNLLTVTTTTPTITTTTCTTLMVAQPKPTTTINTAPPFTVLNVPVPKRSKPEVRTFVRPLVSKLDLAIARRIERRLKRQQELKSVAKSTTNALLRHHHADDSDSSMYSTSDSESEDGNQKLDLWITSGPPDRPNYKGEKVGFLKIFGLTTPMDKNEVELAKLQRRKWHPPWPAMLLDQAKKPTCLDLPVPNSHPSVLTRTPDFGAKVHFLSGLGLRTVPDRSREEWEILWQKIIQSRRKRDGDTALTTYCIRAYRKLRTNILHNNNRALLPVEIPRLNGQHPSLPHTVPGLPVESHTQTQFFTAENIPNHPVVRQNIPVIQPQQFHHQHQRNHHHHHHQQQQQHQPLLIPSTNHINSVPLNGLKRSLDGYSCVAVKRISLDSSSAIQQPIEIKKEVEVKSVDNKDKFKWPGLQEVMESYHRYNKERAVELQHLRSRCSYLCDQIRRRQTEADVLERKLRELRSLHIFHDQERQQIQRCVDQLKAVPNMFR